MGLLSSDKAWDALQDAQEQALAAKQRQNQEALTTSRTDEELWNLVKKLKQVDKDQRKLIVSMHKTMDQTVSEAHEQLRQKRLDISRKHLEQYSDDCDHLLETSRKVRKDASTTRVQVQHMALLLALAWQQYGALVGQSLPPPRPLPAQWQRHTTQSLSTSSSAGQSNKMAAATGTLALQSNTALLHPSSALPSASSAASSPASSQPLSPTLESSSVSSQSLSPSPKPAPAEQPVHDQAPAAAARSQDQGLLATADQSTAPADSAAAAAKPSMPEIL